MSLVANEPSSIAKVLDASFKLFKASFSKTIGFGILIGLISSALSLAGNYLGQNISEGDTTGPVIFLIIALVGFFCLFGLYAGMIFRIDNVAHQRDDSFAEAIGVAIRKFPVMLLAIFLYSIAILLGTLLLVIPGLILALSLFFYAYYIVLEDRSAFQSLKASHKLVWKDWWRTMGVFTVPSILIMIFYFAFVMLMLYFGVDENGMSWAEAGMNLFTGVFTIYFYALGYVQFQDLKLRKSGSDLEARMAE